MPPVPERQAAGGMVCAVDHLAAGAGVEMLRNGGSATDAAVATNAVLAVTSQHLCGMGGDLWALVQPGPGAEVVALNASGRAGSGADAGRLRARGLAAIPPFEDPATVTVPGCVDGWLALHQRFGRLPLSLVMEPAMRYAFKGFPVSSDLVAAARRIIDLEGAEDYRVPGGLRSGALVKRPGVGRALEAVVDGGREAFYGGEFGEGLVAICGGLLTASDLARPQADWMDAIHLDAWDHRIWSAPPASQGYLTVTSAWMAAGLDLPATADEVRWAHLLAESSRQAAFDRLAVLHDGADADTLLDPGQLGYRRAAIDPAGISGLGMPAAAGDTTGLCAVDSNRQAVSLLQSNASGWGSGLIVPGVRIFLHNRGRGFSLLSGHPAEYGPGRRPPHTLCPTLVTGPDMQLRAALATMGGDSQPQILLQLLARMLHGGQEPGEAIAAGRFSLCAPVGPDGGPTGDGFDTWRDGGRVAVRVEGHAPVSWAVGLKRLGHTVLEEGAYSSAFGHAQAIEVTDDDVLRGGSDPRAPAGAVEGL